MYCLAFIESKLSDCFTPNGVKEVFIKSVVPKLIGTIHPEVIIIAPDRRSLTW